jgi:hypothetical protein
MTKPARVPEHDLSENAESPWSYPLPGESSESFSRFKQYRDLGAQRTFTKVAQTSNISVSAVAQMARTNRWRDRAWSYDWHERRLAELALARERRQARETSIKIAMAMQSIGVHGLVELQRKVERGEALNLSVNELTTMAKLGQDLIDQSLGFDPDDAPLRPRIVVFMNGEEYKPPPPLDDEPKKPN